MLTLKQWMLRSEVLTLYRSFLRSTKGLQGSTRWETIDFVRSNFESSKHVKDTEHVKYLLANGRNQLKQFQTMVHMAK